MYKHEELTREIIGAFYRVYRTMGYGFLEKAYENALVRELGIHKHNIVQQAPIDVWYRNSKVGTYFADLLVEDKVVVELKSVERLGREHHAQLLNYLKAGSYEVGLLLNFGVEPQIARKVFDNARKGFRRRSVPSISGQQPS
jgi:GxxExxY protein